MRFFIVYMLLFLLGSSSLFSQSLDTIEVSIDYAATLQFNDNLIIDDIVYGNNPPLYDEYRNFVGYKHYDEFRRDNKAVIAGNNDTIPMTTVAIFLSNGDLYHGYIKYSENPQKTYYPFIDNMEKDIVIETEQIIRSRLGYLMQRPQEYTELGVDKDHIEFIVSNMMNDETQTYVKLVVNNNSSGKYEMKGITFMHEENKNKGLKGLLKKSDLKDIEGKEINNTKRIFPDYETPDNSNVIEAYSSETFGYAIPLFTTARGDLIINLSEESGTRNMTIKIKANEIAKIKVF